MGPFTLRQPNQCTSSNSGEFSHSSCCATWKVQRELNLLEFPELNLARNHFIISTKVPWVPLRDWAQCLLLWGLWAASTKPSGGATEGRGLRAAVLNLRGWVPARPAGEGVPEQGQHVQRHRGVKEHGVFQQGESHRLRPSECIHGRNEAVEGRAPKSGKGGGFSSVEGDLRRWPRAGGTQTACGGGHGLGLGA